MLSVVKSVNLILLNMLTQILNIVAFQELNTFYVR